jgi:putative membrane protein
MEPWQSWWPGMGFMWIFPLLFLIVMVVFLVRGPGWFRRDNGRGERRETTREIIDRRYANGEITKEQHEEMKQRLER